jgi:hypothetical protein
VQLCTANSSRRDSSTSQRHHHLRLLEHYQYQSIGPSFSRL